MTDELDASLRRRLEGLAAAVPVDDPGAIHAVPAARVRASRAGQGLALGGLIPIVAILAAGTLIAGVLKVGPFAPGATNVPTEGAAAVNGPVSSSTRSGDFELTIRAADGRPAIGEPIEIEASLVYVGAAPSVDIGHGHGANLTPLAFGIEEPIEEHIRLEASWDAICTRSTLQAQQPITAPFRKMGGWSDPKAGEFFLDPVLLLPVGTWHVYVDAWFSIAEGDDICSDPVKIRASVAITVAPDVASQPTAPPAQSDQPNPPQSATDRDGDFELTLLAGKARYLPNEPIDVTGALAYVGSLPEVEITHDSAGPVMFAIREDVFGEIDVGGFSRLMCGGSTLRRGEPVIESFKKAGSFSGDHPDAAMFRAWFRDPALRLPAGTWHISAQSSGSDAPCYERGPTFSVSAEIVIEVVDDVPTATPLPTEQVVRPFPTNDPGSLTGRLQPDGSVLAVTNDRVFLLRLEAGRRVYLADEPIDIETISQYIGSEAGIEVSSFGPFVSFQINQLDATGPTRSVMTIDSYSVCTTGELTRGTDVEAPLQGLNTLSGDDAQTVWANLDLTDSTLRLPPGRWRITAMFGAYLGPSFSDCQDETSEHHGLRAAVDIVVAPGAGSTIELRTASEPSAGCDQAFASGELAVDPDSGLGVIPSTGVPMAVMWPFGYTARLEAGGAFLRDPEGDVVAREGMTVAFTGSPMGDDAFFACTGITIVVPAL